MKFLQTSHFPMRVEHNLRISLHISVLQSLLAMTPSIQSQK